MDADTIRTYAEIGAAIGTFALAMVTYLTLSEMRKGRLFELKRTVYFELLDILSKAINKWRNIELDEEGPNISDKSFTPIIGDIDIYPEIFINTIVDLDVIELKIRLCDGPREIIDTIKLVKERLLENPHDVYSIIGNKLIPELINELITTKAKHWWQFWK